MSSIALIAFMVATGGQATNQGRFSNADGADSKFTDSVFQVPIYPGAKLVPGSSQRIGIDKAQGWLASCQLLPPGGWGRTYSLLVDYKKVEAYYRKEGAKVGKVNKSAKNYSRSGFTLLFDLPHKEHIYVIGGKLDRDGSTRFSVYYFLNRATPVKSKSAK